MTPNTLDIRKIAPRPLVRYCEPQLSYARALARTTHVSIRRDVCGPSEHCARSALKSGSAVGRSIPQ